MLEGCIYALRQTEKFDSHSNRRHEQGGYHNYNVSLLENVPAVEATNRDGVVVNGRRGP